MKNLFLMVLCLVLSFHTIARCLDKDVCISIILPSTQTVANCKTELPLVKLFVQDIKPRNPFLVDNIDFSNQCNIGKFVDVPAVGFNLEQLSSFLENRLISYLDKWRLTSDELTALLYHNALKRDQEIDLMNSLTEEELTILKHHIAEIVNSSVNRDTDNFIQEFEPYLKSGKYVVAVPYSNGTWLENDIFLALKSKLTPEELARYGSMHISNVDSRGILNSGAKRYTSRIDDVVSNILSVLPGNLYEVEDPEGTSDFLNHRLFSSYLNLSIKAKSQYNSISKLIHEHITENTYWVIDEMLGVNNITDCNGDGIEDDPGIMMPGGWFLGERALVSNEMAIGEGVRICGDTDLSVVSSNSFIFGSNIILDNVKAGACLLEVGTVAETKVNIKKFRISNTELCSKILENAQNIRLFQMVEQDLTYISGGIMNGVVELVNGQILNSEFNGSPINLNQSTVLNSTVSGAVGIYGASVIESNTNIVGSISPILLPNGTSLRLDFSGASVFNSNVSGVGFIEGLIDSSTFSGQKYYYNDEGDSDPSNDSVAVSHIRPSGELVSGGVMAGISTLSGKNVGAYVDSLRGKKWPSGIPLDGTFYGRVPEGCYFGVRFGVSFGTICNYEFVGTRDDPNANYVLAPNEGFGARIDEHGKFYRVTVGE